MAGHGLLAKWLIFFSAVLSTSLFGWLPASADVVQTFTLSNVTFSDGSSAEGFYTYDFSTHKLLSVSVSAGGDISNTFQFVLDTPLTQSTGSKITLDPSLSLETIDTGTVTTLAVVSGSVFPNSALPFTTATLSGAAGSNGWYTGPVTVTLTAAAGMMPVAATYYTLDGGAQQTYTGPFVVSAEAAHTLTFRSVDTGGNLEGIETAAVNVDGTPPVTTAGSSSGGALVYSATDNASGVGATYYTVDGGAAQTAAGGSITVAAGGAHSIQLWSVDAAGNVEASNLYHVYTLPSVPGAPQVVICSPTTITLTWTASQDSIGVAGYRLYKLVGHSGRGGGYSWVLVASPASNLITLPFTGAATMAVRAIDSLGSLSKQSAAAIIQNDFKTLGLLALSGDNTPGSTEGVVTAVFPGYFYIEDANRAHGILVTGSASAQAGDDLTVAGALSTNTDGERAILVSSVVRNGSGTVAPLNMNNPAIGGGDWHYNPATGAGALGAPSSAPGLLNVGLLIRSWGRVTYVDPNAQFFTIFQEAGPGASVSIVDADGHPGIRISAGGMNLPAVGDFVFVTGISSLYSANQTRYPRILARDQADIQVAVSASSLAALPLQK